MWVQGDLVNTVVNGKKQSGLLSKPLGLIFTIFVVLFIPLPFALYLAGTEWIFSGSEGVPKEFVVSYLLGLALLLGSIILAIFRDRRKKKVQ